MDSPTNGSRNRPPDAIDREMRAHLPQHRFFGKPPPSSGFAIYLTLDRDGLSVRLGTPIDPLRRLRDPTSLAPAMPRSRRFR